MCACVCDEENTNSNEKNTDGDGERCTTTDVFKTRGQYVGGTHIGDECSKLEETRAEVIIFVKNHSLQNISCVDCKC